MLSPLRKSRSNDLPDKIKELIQSLSNEKDRELLTNIYTKVTKKTHNYESPQKEDGTIKKCIESFNQGANPEVLTKLEKALRDLLEESPEKKEEYQKHYKYYIKNFLSVLKDEVMKLKVELSVSNNEIEQLQRSPTRRGKIVGIILDITKRSSDKDSKIEEQPINSIKEEIPVSSTGMTENNVESLMTQDQTQQKLESLTKEEVCVSDSDSGVSLGELSKESLKSPINSRRSSISSTLSSAGEGNDPVLSKQIAEKKPQVQESENSSGQADPNQVKNEISPGIIQVADIGIQREKNTDPSGQAAQMTGSQIKNPMQPKEKKDREKATTTVQKLPVNEKKGEDIPLKQPNNRNLHVALAAGCALSTIGCIVAGAMTSGLIGAGLLAMAAVFAIAAVAELHSNFLSSKLTSINVSPLVDDKELTACSQR